MALLEQINTDLVTATKGNEPLVRDTLRMLKTNIKNSEINLGHELSDEEIVDVIAKAVKQRLEAAQSFKDGNRLELAAQEENEMTILKKYLPEQLSEEEVASLVQAAITESGATAMSEMGKVMAILMPQVKGKADGNLVGRLVREKLS